MRQLEFRHAATAPELRVRPREGCQQFKKHGVDFLEAITVLNDPLSSTLADDQHSRDEVRSITIGMSSRQRLLFVV